MKPFRLSIVAPDKTFFDGETTQIIVRTTEGDVGILAGHENYVANLPSGPLKIKQEDNTNRLAAIAGGMISVTKDEVTVLATAIEWADEIDVDRAKRAEEIARKRLETSQSSAEMDRATLKLKRALNRIGIASK